MINFAAGFLFGVATGMLVVLIVDAKERDEVKAMKAEFSGATSKSEVAEEMYRELLKMKRHNGGVQLGLE